MIFPGTVFPTATLKPGYENISPEGKEGLGAIEGKKQRGRNDGKVKKGGKVPLNRS